MGSASNFTKLEIEACNAIMEQDKLSTNFYIIEGSEIIDDMVIPLDLNKLFDI